MAKPHEEEFDLSLDFDGEESENDNSENDNKEEKSNVNMSTLESIKKLSALKKFSFDNDSDDNESDSSEEEKTENVSEDEEDKDNQDEDIAEKNEDTDEEEIKSEQDDSEETESSEENSDYDYDFYKDDDSDDLENDKKEESKKEAEKPSSKKTAKNTSLYERIRNNKKKFEHSDDELSEEKDKNNNKENKLDNPNTDAEEKTNNEDENKEQIEDSQEKNTQDDDKDNVKSQQEEKQESEEKPEISVENGKTHIKKTEKKKSLFDKSRITKKEENEEYLEYQNKSYVDGEDGLTKEVTDRALELRKISNTKPLESVRVLTLDILVKAPPKYFNKFGEVVKNGVNYVRGKIADENLSKKISDANENQTNEKYQNDAYLSISPFITEFVRTTEYRDANAHIIRHLIVNEILGFDMLDPLWRAPVVTEIVCNGPYDIQVEIAGEMMKIESIEFRDPEHLERLLERLFRGVGKVLAQATPQAKGRLHDKSRIFATHRAICPEGPNFNIRRHPEGFWTPEVMVEKGAANEEVMSFIGNLIQKGGSYIIAGGTSTGKTSMLNALSGFYPPHARILTLEDNLEMKPNPKKYVAAALETRPPAPDKPNDRGVTMRDLVWGAMQMRPEVLIIGEVTDAAAYDLCQALNTGHAGASTFHANSSQLAITRVASLVAQSGLTTIDGAFDLIAAAFDFVINVRHFPQDGSRKIYSIDEVGTDIEIVDGKQTLKTNQLWKFVFQGLDEQGKIVGTWEQRADISEERRERRMFDAQPDMTWEELIELSSLPEGTKTA